MRLILKKICAHIRAVFSNPVEWLSPFFNPLRTLVDEFVCLQVIFWNLLAFPPLHEILIKQGIKTMVLLRVPEYILRHRLDILSRMIMLYPNVISQKHQFDMRIVRVELELDILLCELQGFEELHRTSQLLAPVADHRSGRLQSSGAHARLST